MLLQVNKRKSTLWWLLCIGIFCAGYVGGVFLNPLISSTLRKHHQAHVDIEQVLSQTLVNLQTETAIAQDTLRAHERNLLVFWSPTCKYSRQFFQYRLNSDEIGIFCMPITDDFNYVKYFVEQNEISYIQLCTADTNGIIPIDAPSVVAVPTFIVLDSKGNVIEEKRGIIDIDLFIENLYKKN